MSTTIAARQGKKPNSPDDMKAPMLVNFTHRHRVWVQNEATKRGIPMSEVIRELLEREMAK